MEEGDKKRFWDKVDKGGDHECWEWEASKIYSGYGRFKWQGKTWGAHRISWMLANDREIPDDMLVCHHCDNPFCVNPAHLFLGTNIDNQRDSWQKNRKSLQGENHTHNKLNNKQVVLIKKMYLDAELDRGEKTLFCKFWANKFGVGWTTIRQIINGINWTHIIVERY